MLRSYIHGLWVEWVTRVVDTEPKLHYTTEIKLVTSFHSDP